MEDYVKCFKDYIELSISGRPIPWKRTTQRQKFCDKSYHKYLEYKDKIKTIAEQSSEMLESKEVFRIEVNVMLYGGGINKMGIDADIDNYVKCALDSCQGVLYENDRMCFEEHGKKISVDSPDKQGMLIRLYCL